MEQLQVTATFPAIAPGAVLIHLANVGDRLAKIVELGGGLEVDMFGDPSAELREAAAAFQPAVFTFFQGK